jgi:hypothetical protein
MSLLAVVRVLLDVIVALMDKLEMEVITKLKTAGW